jgi:hypothetical protein
MDVFSISLPRDYISSTETNQIGEKQRESQLENENGESPQQSRKKGLAEDLTVSHCN